MLCQREEREAGRQYPRTCPTCKLGPCHKFRATPLQSLADSQAEIARLTAELTALRAGQDALVAAAYEAAADHAGGAWFFSFPTDDRKEPYRNAARAIHALTPADATAALDSMLRAERDKALREAADALCAWGEDAPQSGQFFAEAILAMIETEDQTNDR